MNTALPVKFRGRFFFILTFALLAGIACQKKQTNPGQGGPSIFDPGLPRPQSDGGQHTGGGSTTQSPPELVNQMLDKAIAMALEDDWSKNIFAQFIQDGAFAASASKDADRIEFFRNPKYLFPSLNKSGVKLGEGFVSPMLKAFSKNTIERIPRGDCPRPPEEETADASVSEHTLSAIICCSIGNLTKLPPSILLRELLGLVLHEAAHMGGASEPEAKRYQKYFTQYFAARFGDITVNDFTERAKVNLKFANLRIKRAKVLAEQKPESPVTYAQMGGILGSVNSIPYMDDALLIELKAQPKNPKFVEHFWYTLNLVSQQISSAFEPVYELTTYTLVPFMGRIAYPDEVLGKINEQERGIECLSEILSAFETGELRKECMAKPLTPIQKLMLLPRNVSYSY